MTDITDTPDTGGWPWLRNEVTSALDEVTSTLEGLDGTATVPNLTWTVADLAAHLACLPQVYRTQDELGPDFETPDDFAPFSDLGRAHIDTTDLASVVSLLRAEVTGLVEEVDGHHDPGRARWLYGQSTTHANVVAGLLAELLIHGHDLHPLSGRSFTVTRDQAAVIVPAMLTVMPAFIDRSKARRAAGVHHLWLRPDDHWAYHISDDGEVEVRHHRPRRPDSHLWVDPVAFLLVGLGRRHPLMATLTGQMVAWGRRPWKLAATANMTVNGI